MPSAIGSNPVVDRAGDVFYDVWEWGGRPMEVDRESTVDDVLEKIRTAIIQRRASGDQRRVTIYFRPGTWQLKFPFFADQLQLTIEGADSRTTTLTNYFRGFSYPMLILGLERVPKNSDGTPHTLSADHWVDAYTILDATAASAANQRWGLHVNSDAFASFWATGFSVGMRDRWTGVKQFTLEFCIDPGTGNQVQPGVLMGMADIDDRPAPWYLSVSNPNEFLFEFETLSPSGSSDVRKFRFTSPSTGLQRIALQLDLDHCTIQTWVNGTQVAVQSLQGTGAGGASWPATGLTFTPNDYSPFHIGVRSAATSKGPHPFADRTIFGLRMDSTLRYVDNGLGSPQARIDGSTINDYSSYFDPGVRPAGTTCMGLLALTDGPAGTSYGRYDGRLITVQPVDKGGNGYTCGLWFPVPITTPISGTYLKKLTITSIAPYYYTQAVTIGSILDLRIEDVRADGGWRGIGSLNMVASYYIRMKDVRCHGRDAGYYGWKQLIQSDGYDGGNLAGDYGIRLVGCSAVFRNTVFAGGQATSYVRTHPLDYGGNYLFDSFFIDNEGGNYPSESVFTIEMNDTTPNMVRIHGLDVGTLGSTASAVLLKDRVPPAPNKPSGMFDLDGYTFYGTVHQAQVISTGSSWVGEIRNLSNSIRDYDRVPFVLNASPDGKGCIVSRHGCYVGPPRQGTWNSGQHILEVPSAAPGQYHRLNCVRSGSYGTLTPPVWAGSEPMVLTGDELGAYVVDHVAIASSLSLA